MGLIASLVQNPIQGLIIKNKNNGFYFTHMDSDNMHVNAVSMGTVLKYIAVQVTFGTTSITHATINIKGSAPYRMMIYCHL